ncbi:MAG TPA: glycosyltransferase family 1 protein [Acidimicrobiales bacterium]
MGLNLLWLVPGDVGGSEDYAVGLVRELVRAGDVDVTVFCQPELADAYPDLAATGALVPGPGFGERRSLRLFWENSWLPYQVRSLGIDLLHHLGGTVPPLAATRSVLTVYDLQPLTHPERFRPAKRAWLRTALPRSARHAARVLTLSEHVRQDVVRHLGVPADRVLVVPPGVRGARVPDPAAAADARRRHGIDPAAELLLYPAITYPHKNHEVVVRAMPKVVAQRPQATLVLTGRPGPGDAAIDALAADLGIAGAVRRLGRLPRHDLDALFDSADALLFPSIHEGFGLPLLEAMTRGCPILAADASCIPEIVGAGGVLLPPTDPAAWADAVVGLLGDPGRRAELVRASADGLARFRWEDTAAAILDVYRELATA